jgi:integrase
MKKDISDKWRVSVFIDGKRVTKRFTHKSDALRWKATKSREKELSKAGLDSPYGKMLIGEWIESWLKQRRRELPLSTTSQDDNRAKNYLIPRFGHRPLGAVDSEEWGEFFNFLLDNGLSKATRNRFRSLLHKMYADAIRAKKADKNPISIIPLLDEKKRGVLKYWDNADVIETYLSAAKEREYWHYLFAVISLNTGLRCSEVLALKWSDMDRKNRTIKVYKIVERISKTVVHRTKGGDRAPVPMNDVIAELVTRNDDDWIFENRGQPRTYEEVRWAHEYIVEKYKLPRITLHGLRHTFGSHYLMNGGSKTELKEIFGHSTEIITERYSHIADSHLRKKINLVGFNEKTRQKRAFEETINAVHQEGVSVETK